MYTHLYNNKKGKIENGLNEIFIKDLYDNDLEHYKIKFKHFKNLPGCSKKTNKELIKVDKQLSTRYGI